MKYISRTVTCQTERQLAKPVFVVRVVIDPVLVGPENELPLGESKTVAFGRYPAIVIHTENGLKAYSAVCTHFACIVMWEPGENWIACPCHAGFFDPEDGSVISGPPPGPLTQLETEIIDGDIYVKAGGEA